MAPRDKVPVSAAKQRDANPVDSTRADAVCSSQLPLICLLLPQRLKGVAVLFCFFYHGLTRKQLVLPADKLRSFQAHRCGPTGVIVPQ